MTIGNDKMNVLRAKAKDAFDVAVAMGIYRPEGVAILMKSGLVVSGYTQYDTKGDAAQDALRAVKPCFPEDAKPKSKALDHFAIAAVLVLTKRKYINPATLATLREYPEVVEQAQIFHAKLGTGSDKSFVSVQAVTALENNN